MKQNTLLLIKPNATKKHQIGEILQMIEENGFVIEKLKMFEMDNALADTFYVEHLGKGFYHELSEFMRSGKIVGAMLSREDAVLKLRELVGNTDCAKAALGTIRSIYGESIGENAVHASDSIESAKREIGLIFPE
ncbi:MAG: nucleoside-diphosphate kinase [Candidatus Cloacimonetes bacterium]|jgi:nucleoside-diphosphate kinase|nr:nucleoside-diphosphate kinase [Candidatus Cloacimonadota bacterium]